MRPHQWSKNILLFFPLVLAHRMFEPGLLGLTLLAAVCFCLMASSVYVLNDYMDVEADRKHPEKKTRPLAAGTVPLQTAPWLSAGLALISLALAVVLLHLLFAALLLAYLCANLVYSSFLKHVPVLDTVFLTLMFVMRICAGGLAGNVPVSFWLLTFSLFFFLSIALTKRVQELQLSQQFEETPPREIRGYYTADLPCISQLGISSGLVSVLVLALYMNSEEMIRQYHSPLYLWLLCPLMLFWTGRFWLITLRGRMLHDPILFALKDPTSYAVLLMVMTVLQFAYWL